MEVRFWSSVGNQTYYNIKYEILHSYLISVVVRFLLYHLSLLSWDRDAFRCYQQHNVGRHIFSFREWIPQVKQCHDRNSLPSQKFAFGFNSERWGWKHEKGLCTVQWYFYWHASLSAWLFGQWASLCVSSRKLNSVTIFSIEVKWLLYKHSCSSERGDLNSGVTQLSPVIDFTFRRNLMLSLSLSLVVKVGFTVWQGGENLAFGRSCNLYGDGIPRQLPFSFTGVKTLADAATWSTLFDGNRECGEECSAAVQLIDVLFPASLHQKLWIRILNNYAIQSCAVLYKPRTALKEK